MAFLRPPDDGDAQYEFFAPFVHIEGKYEWCRIRSPTHGVFDTFIDLTSDPVAVYVADEVGARFMHDRYPECKTYPATIGLQESDDGLQVTGRLACPGAPITAGAMTFRAQGGTPEQVPYGGTGEPVWGSKRFTCWGVDLNLPARATGTMDTENGRIELDEHAILTLGSFGRIAPLPED